MYFNERFLNLSPSAYCTFNTEMQTSTQEVKKKEKDIKCGVLDDVMR